ncbi:MAG: hypothetical protein SF187_23015 [Deltaproteobacteria bacterium]|nr:hypothetical protein [Deltaproteobacteria bacterium]
MKVVLALLTLGFVALASTDDVRAQDASHRPLPYPSSAPYNVAPPPGYHQHDGFYLHIELGFAGGSSKTTLAGTELSLSGGGVDFALALGGAVAPHWVVFGEVQVLGFDEPTSKIDGQEVNVLERQQSFDFGGVGPGVAYYFDPSNIFLSASVLISSLSVTDVNGKERSTDGGAGINLKVGKEWWVSQDWALGVLFGVHASSAKEKDEGFVEPPRWHNRGAFLSFSATYN